MSPVLGTRPHPASSGLECHRPGIILKTAVEPTQRRKDAKTQPNCAKRLECVELAPAFGSPPPYDSASPSSVAALRRVDKLDVLQTLRVAVHPQEPLQLASNSDYCTKDKTRPHISAFCFPSFCSFPRCVLASWRLCVNLRFPAAGSPTWRLC